MANASQWMVLSGCNKIIVNKYEGEIIMALLKGLKVLDFSALLPGPFATLMLADLGAEVVHVQRPTESEAWIVDNYLNRSKKSLTADLKQPESIELMKELVKEYDIVLEQFRPGVMDRLGLGYEDLKKVNPSIIYCSLTGYGQTGPYRDRPGHDINYISMAGLAGYSGTKTEGPAQNSTQIADIAGGSLHSVIGILSAVIYRQRTGEGQYLDISMTDCALTLNALTAPSYLVNGENPKPEETMLNGGTFYGFYETKDGKHFSVGSLEPQFRKLLCEAIDREGLYQLSLSQKPDDVVQFKNKLKEAFTSKTFAEWNEIFTEVEACVEPVLSMEETFNHPNTIKREMIVDVPKLDGGTQKQIANPIKSSVFTPVYQYVGVNPGHHNEEILGKSSQKKDIR